MTLEHRDRMFDVSADGPPVVSVRRVRYDGVADWYDDNCGIDAEGAAALHDLIGENPGTCLDLGCGTGQYFAFLADWGARVIGLDLSFDQLRLAQKKLARLVRAEAETLPFASESFDTVAAIWISTDVEDLQRVLIESSRVLRPGGRLVLFGVHPCFNGPHVEAMPDGSRLIHPGYREARWHEDSPWWGDGIRRRTGMRHVPLASLLGAVIDAGLIIEKVSEPRQETVPYILGLSATKRAAEAVTGAEAVGRESKDPHD